MKLMIISTAIALTIAFLIGGRLGLLVGMFSDYFIWSFLLAQQKSKQRRRHSAGSS